MHAGENRRETEISTSDLKKYHNIYSGFDFKISNVVWKVFFSKVQQPQAVNIVVYAEVQTLAPTIDKLIEGLVL